MDKVDCEDITEETIRNAFTNDSFSSWQDDVRTFLEDAGEEVQIPFYSIPA